MALGNRRCFGACPLYAKTARSIRVSFPKLTYTSASSVLGLVARNLLTLSIFGSCAPRLLDSDAAERKVDMFVTKKDGRMSRILTIVAAQLGLVQSSGDRASVVQHMLDLCA